MVLLQRKEVWLMGIIHISGLVSCGVYVEIGSTTCFSFSNAAEDVDRDIKRGNIALCIQYSGSNDVGIKFDTALSSPFNCTGNNSHISLCISNITKDVEGQYDYSSNKVLESITLSIASPPTVHTLNNTTIVEGADFIKKCLYDKGKPPETNVYWTRQGSFFRQEGDVLNLTKIQRISSGTYICTTENQYSSGNKGQSKQSMIINVEYPPAVSVLTNKDIIEGDNLSVTCSVTNGNPSQTTIYWNKTGDSGFRQNGAELQLQRIQRDRAGTYTCTAENRYSIGGTGSSNQSMTVNVLYPPTVSILTNKNIIEGYNLSVTCSITNGNPTQTTIYWTKTGDSGFRQNGAKLQIQRIQRDRAGAYTCTAENNYSIGGTGSSNQSMTVNVFYPPIVSVLTNKDILEGDNLSVTCSVTNGNPSQTTIYWTKTGDSGFRQNGVELQIQRIQRAMAGAYTCTAENNYSIEDTGSSSQSVTVNVLYPPTVSVLTNKAIIEGDNLSVTCSVTHGNPPQTAFHWTKTGDSGFRQNDAKLQIQRIQRDRAGTYTCTAENRYSIGGTGSSNQSMTVNVLYPPTVSILTNRDIIEGHNLSVMCSVTNGNPPQTTFSWTKTGDSGFRQNAAELQIQRIQRDRSGTYTCTAENSYSIGGTGSSNQSMIVNVLYPPKVLGGTTFYTNESEKITLTRNISSNPPSNVYWFKERLQVFKQESVTTAKYTINETKCTDTGNYTLTASNRISNDSAPVELLVYCRPKIKKNITLGITDEIGIEFSANVIAYPHPSYRLYHINKTVVSDMTSKLFVNAVNNFTIKYNQTAVTKSDYGVYILEIENTFGKADIFVDVIPERKPNPPEVISVICYVGSADVTWKSSFNGGDAQTFIAIAIKDGHYEVSRSSPITDKGEDKEHVTSIHGLQPSVSYIFNVSAINSHGETSNTGPSCSTKEKAGANLSEIAGGTAAGGISLAIIVIALVIVLRRYRGLDNRAAKSQRLKHDVTDDDSSNDDGLKDNILYVPAGPRDNEKLGNSDIAEYAEVNKKGSGSDSNANVYAEVKKKEEAKQIYADVKPKKGLFKKGEKTKQKKGKKQKSDKDGQDVYENSEGFVLEQKLDENVYSNAIEEGHSKEKEKPRGYKNQDGLLYVEVKFDTKSENGKPIIHGEEEKTDYATVEFPYQSTSHDAASNNEGTK